MKKIIDFLLYYWNFCKKNRIQNNAAALSYYLTMTLFPTLVVLYTLLGDNYRRMMHVVEYVEEFLPVKLYDSLCDFLAYVALNHSRAMLYAGVALLVTAASSAVGCIQLAIRNMQGEEQISRFKDTFINLLYAVILKLLYAVILVAAIYFAVLAMLFGENMLSFILRYIPIPNFIPGWLSGRFMMLAAILFLFFFGLFYATKKRDHSYNILPGAILGTLSFVLVSYFYSLMLDNSVNYSVVYGSLASIILLMVWLYTICLVIYAAAAFNIAYDRYKKTQE